MRRSLGETSDAEFGLREDGERFTTRVVREPRLAHEERACVLVTPGVDLRFGPFDDQERVGIGVASRRREQRLGGVPGTPRKAERIGAVGSGVVGARDLLGSGRRREDQRRDPEGSAATHLADRLTRASTR